MSLSYFHDHLGSVSYHSEPSEFRGPLFPKPVTGQELFFAVSSSKVALVLVSYESKAKEDLYTNSPDILIFLC